MNQSNANIVDRFIEMLRLEMESDDERVEAITMVADQVCLCCGDMNLPCGCMRDD